MASVIRKVLFLGPSSFVFLLMVLHKRKERFLHFFEMSEFEKNGVLGSSTSEKANRIASTEPQIPGLTTPYHSE